MKRKKKEVNELQEEMIPKFIDLRTARKMYSISRCKLLELIYQRKIIATKKTGKWLIKTESLENYLLGDYNTIEEKVNEILASLS